MSKVSVLITGCDGFIGKTFLKKIDTTRYDVYALDVRPLGDRGTPKIKGFYHQDISRKFQLNRAFDFVFHLAAYNVTHVGERETHRYQRVNVKGTYNLLKSAEIKNFIFMSSAKVYKNDGEPISEGSPLSPVDAYEKSKLEGEEICHRFFKGESLTILRSINIVGPQQEEKAVIPVFFKNAYRNLPLKIVASRHTYLQLLFVDDAVHAFELILTKGGLNGIYNLSSGEKIRLDELAQKIIRLSHSCSSLKFLKKKDTVFSEVLSDKIKMAMGWNARTGINGILRAYGEYYRKIHAEK